MGLFDKLKRTLLGKKEEVKEEEIVEEQQEEQEDLVPDADVADESSNLEQEQGTVQDETLNHESSTLMTDSDERKVSESDHEAPIDLHSVETSIDILDQETAAEPAVVSKMQKEIDESIEDEQNQVSNMSKDHQASFDQQQLKQNIDEHQETKLSHQHSVQEDDTIAPYPIEELEEETEIKVQHHIEQSSSREILEEELEEAQASSEILEEEQEEAQESSEILEEEQEEAQESSEILEEELEEAQASSEVLEEHIEEEVQEIVQQEKIDKGLKKTRKTFGERINALFAKFRTVDEAFFEALEETLIGADVGFETSMLITDAVKEQVKLKNLKKQEDIQQLLVQEMIELYESAGPEEDPQLNIQPEGLTVILFVGVNGVGKTTTIGKMAHQQQQEGKKVMVAAGDTFRAGAIDQLVVWGERAGVDVVQGAQGSDPAAVVYDAIHQAKQEDVDVLFVDTAGRLQNKVNLMKELEKIKRIIERECPGAPHEVLLVLDATTGQNALIQAKQFKETTDVTGIVLTKLDGTAKGGMIIPIRRELQLPVKFVGVGEGIHDLQPFSSEAYVYGLFRELLDVSIKK